MKNKDVIEKYLKYCKANLAPATVRAYESFIRLFSERTNKDFGTYYVNGIAENMM